MELLFFGNFSTLTCTTLNQLVGLWLNFHFTTVEVIICYHYYVQSLVPGINEQESSQGRKCDFKNTKVFEVP